MTRPDRSSILRRHRPPRQKPCISQFFELWYPFPLPALRGPQVFTPHLVPGRHWNAHTLTALSLPAESEKEPFLVTRRRKWMLAGRRPPVSLGVVAMTRVLMSLACFIFGVVLIFGPVEAPAQVAK